MDIESFAIENDRTSELTESLKEVKENNYSLLKDMASNGRGVNPAEVGLLRLDILIEMLLGGDDSVDRLSFELEFESRMNPILVDLAAQARMAKLTAP